MKRALLLFALVLLPSCGGSQSHPAMLVGDPSSAGKLAPLQWMAGAWHGSTNDGETDEMWSMPSGRSMQGLGRTVKDGRTTFFEFMTIEEGDKDVIFTAWPKGRAPTQFRLVSVKPEEVVFENPEHDFPQRIIYTHEADGMLHARAEGRVKGEARTDQYWLRQVR
jgi:hypothetical protein